MMARKCKFTVKQKRFVTEYLKDYNGSRAAVEAGYSPKYAKESAYHLIHKSLPVKEAIEREEEERLHRAGVEAEKVLTRMARICFADIQKLYGPNIPSWMLKIGRMTLLRQWQG